MTSNQRISDALFGALVADAAAIRRFSFLNFFRFASEVAFVLFELFGS